jgi:putative inorganic carbon (HCO3(-)) transporter
MTERIRSILRRWGWLLVVCAAPFFLLPDPRRIWALLALPVILLLQAWAWGKILPVTPFNLPLLLMAGALGVSLWATPDLAFSLTKISGVLLGILVFFTVARYAQARSGWLLALGGFFLGGVAIAFIGLLGAHWFTEKITLLNQVVERLPQAIQGLPGAETGIQPNELAGVLIWVLPMAGLAWVAFLKDSPWFAGSPASRRRALRSVGWAIFLTGVDLFIALVWILAQSRGSYLGIGMAGLGVGFMLLPRRMRVPAMAVMLLIGIAGLWILNRVGWEAVTASISEALPVGDSAFSLNNLLGRVEVWSHGVWALRDAPLTGLGMNSFREVVHLIYPMLTVSSSFNLGHAHNEFLQVGLDLGLPGLVAFLALYFAAFAMLYHTIRAGGTQRLLALGLGGGLLAHAIYGLTDAVALGAKPGFLFWWLLALIYGLYQQARQQNDPVGAGFSPSGARSAKPVPTADRSYKEPVTP